MAEEYKGIKDYIPENREIDYSGSITAEMLKTIENKYCQSKGDSKPMDNRLELIFTVGLPASGKTTWAKQFVSQWIHEDSWVRVSRDDLRNMRGTYWLPNQEKLITEWEYDCVVSALKRGYNVIVDATNLYEKNRRKLISHLIQCGLKDVHWALKDFTFVPVEECVRRDSLRTERVGETVILDMASKTGLIKEPPTRAFDYNKFSCILVDIDGTLAHNYQGRSFYEWEKVGEDTVDKQIKNIVNNYDGLGHHVIVMSGRDEICRPETEQWLHDNEIKYHRLYMRPEKDMRPDEVVKKELFEKHVEPFYNVDYILDDRNKVVKMWRSLGLKVLQVAEGNF